MTILNTTMAGVFHASGRKYIRREGGGREINTRKEKYNRKECTDRQFQQPTHPSPFCTIIIIMQNSNGRSDWGLCGRDGLARTGLVVYGEPKRGQSLDSFHPHTELHFPPPRYHCLFWPVIRRLASSGDPPTSINRSPTPMESFTHKLNPPHLCTDHPRCVALNKNFCSTPVLLDELHENKLVFIYESL